MQKIKSKINKTFIYQFESYFHLKSINDVIRVDFDDDKFVSKSLDFILNSSSEFIEIINFNSRPSVVPSIYFDEDLKYKYLITNTVSLKTILSDTSYDKKIKIVYSISDKLNEILEKSKLEYSHNNYFTYLYDFIENRNAETNGFSFFVNLNYKSFDIIIFNNDEFIFFNSFNVNDENEFLYYLFFVLKNYEGSNKKDKITFLGKFERFENYYNIASKYSEIDFIVYNNNSSESHESPFFSIINENYIRD